MSLRLLLSCEHAGNEIPEEYRSLFPGSNLLLRSHRGYDIGAYELARYLARETGAPLFHSQISRLLVELNRSLHHPALFSEFSRALPASTRQQILDRYYHPYRRQVEQEIRRWTGDAVVVHLSVHTFTPVLNGKKRFTDIGFLYDPKRANERRFCRSWKQLLKSTAPAYSVRYNYPYRGTADGFTTYLRRHLSRNQYLGVELEVNQAFPLQGKTQWHNLMLSLTTTLQHALGKS